jgi:heme exporter protein D
VSRAYLFAGPVLMLASCVATALAEDPSSIIPGPSMSLDHVLALGPYGALVWGAYLLGRGVKVTVCVELSEKDREALARVRRESGQ